MPQPAAIVHHHAVWASVLLALHSRMGLDQGDIGQLSLASLYLTLSSCNAPSAAKHASRTNSSVCTISSDAAQVKRTITKSMVMLCAGLVVPFDGLLNLAGLHAALQSCDTLQCATFARHTWSSASLLSLCTRLSHSGNSCASMRVATTASHPFGPWRWCEAAPGQASNAPRHQLQLIMSNTRVNKRA